jgi:hypothetical protein
MFGNAESRLFVFAAQCFNTESMQKVQLLLYPSNTAFMSTTKNQGQNQPSSEQQYVP